MEFIGSSSLKYLFAVLCVYYFLGPLHFELYTFKVVGFDNFMLAFDLL